MCPWAKNDQSGTVLWWKGCQDSDSSSKVLIRGRKLRKLEPQSRIGWLGTRETKEALGTEKLMEIRSQRVESSSKRRDQFTTDML